jgi:hypothetical protein
MQLDCIYNTLVLDATVSSIEVAMVYSSRASLRVAAVILPLFPALLSGCSDSDTSAVQSGLAEGPLYAVNTRLFGADFGDPISYIALVDGLDGGEARLDTALELPGAGSMWGEPESGELYLVSAETLTVTQYRLGASGGLEEGGRLGLAGAGVSGLLSEAIAFGVPGQGFLFDLGSDQALELDLAAMEIVGTHDLSALRLDSAELTFLGDAGFQRRGNELVGLVYGSNAAFDRVANESKIGFFDLASGALEVVDAPCGGLQYSLQTADGDFFFSTDPWVAGVHALNASRAPAPCMVRLPAGSRVFDAMPTALNELTGGITGGIIPSDDGFGYVRVLDEAVFPLTPTTDVLAPFSAPAWTTWRLELARPESAIRVERPHIAGGIKFFRDGARVYQNESAADFASTTLVRTTGDGAPAPGLSVPGVPWNVVRVR